MKLVDHQIASLCHGIVPEEIIKFHWMLGNQIPEKVPPMVVDYDPKLINTASLDVRVARYALLRILPGWMELDLKDKSEEDPVWIQPGDRLLLGTKEQFFLPPFISATFYLKSSKARKFYEHLHAGYCDPGWRNSNLTMEIFNADMERLELYEGMRIGQLVFEVTMGIPKNDYSKIGRYNNDSGPTKSKD